MTTTEVIEVLEKHNIWRLGAKTEPTNPKQLTEALEIAINILKKSNEK